MWSNTRWCILCINLLYLKTVICANILVVNDIESPSHHLWNFAYTKGLLEKGHNVTLISPHKTKGANYSNLHHIHLEDMEKRLKTAMEINTDIVTDNPFGQMKLFMDYTYFCCKSAYEANGLQQILNYPSNFKFDLIVFDITLANGCLYPLIQHFNYPPTIGITPFLLPPYVSHYYGNQLHPAYLPFYNFEYSTKMTFFERVKNTFFTYLDSAVKVLCDIPRTRKLHLQHFGENVDSVEKLQRHITLVLANSNPVFNIPQPVTPNIITVGGLHTRPAQELPKDLQAILDSSKNGVILFSLGTNIRSDELDENVRKHIIDAFSQLPYTFLWKFESDLETPKNIIVRKWLPLNDLLAHKNVKLFISHGGALSTQEAMYHGVPVLGVPIFADQYMNILLMMKKKIATKLPLQDISTENLVNTIRETLSNPIYAKNMKEISQRFRDFPQTPLEKAVKWTEYAIKHNGADFLNTQARDLPFYISYGLDVYAFFTFILLLILVILKKIFSLVRNLCRSGSSKLKRE